MTTRDTLDDYLDGAAGALRLPIETAWRPAVKANLEMLLAFADLVDAFPLPEEMPPAPVYRA
jgi:1-carboxybiuret hydrolase subunit AtzG-like